MWESRPLPKIVRDPLAALSARGSFFIPAPPGIFLFWGRQAGAWRFEERKACGEENLFGKKVLPPRAPPFPKLLSGAVACLESIRAIARQCAKEKGKHMARKNVTGSIRFFPRCGRTFRPSYVLLSVRKMSGQDGLARLLCSGMYQKHLLPSGGILAGKDLFSILRAGIPVQGYPLWKMSAPLPQDRRDRGVSSRSLP